MSLRAIGKKKVSKAEGKRGRAKSIKGKLLVAVIGLAVGISVILGGVNAIVLYWDAAGNLSERLSESAAAYALAAENRVKVYKGQIASIASDASSVHASG